MSNDRKVSARALASRLNGARSRGPRTAAGKARSARNALKHGLCAKKLLVLPEEDAAEFRALEAALLAELAPAGALQAVLAARIVSAAWRLTRADRMEAEVLAYRSAPNGDLGIALMRDGNGTRSIETLLRYRNAATAELLRAQRLLQALQAEARADAGAPAASPRTARRRARPRVARPIEPEQPRRINGSTGNRALDRQPPATAPETGTAKPGAELRAFRRSPDLDAPDAALTPRTSPLAGTKRTREIASDQRVAPSASGRSAA